jgi:hypothetical protein
METAGLSTGDRMILAATDQKHGGIVGGTIGYNYQINQFVISFEGYVDWSGMLGVFVVLNHQSILRQDS